MRGWAIGTVAAASLLLAAGAAVAEEPVDIEILAGTCAGCHGAELQGAGAVPRLRGHSADYLRFTLQSFKSGERPATVMDRLARGYRDEEIEALAVYLSELE